MFPTNRSVTRPTPFPTHRLPQGEVSLLSVGTMKGLRLPASIPHAQLPSRDGTAPALWGFALVDARDPVHKPGTWSAEGSQPAMGAEIDGISQVPREPQYAFALLSDPGRIDSTKPIEWTDMAPVPMTTKAPATWPYFEAP